MKLNQIHSQVQQGWIYHKGTSQKLKLKTLCFYNRDGSWINHDAQFAIDFDKNKMFVAESFMAAYEIFKKFANSDTVLLIENDLPDNYLN